MFTIRKLQITPTEGMCRKERNIALQEADKAKALQEADKAKTYRQVASNNVILAPVPRRIVPDWLIDVYK